MNQHRQGGVGMLEVLIALVVLSIGALAHITFQRTAYREIGLAASRMVATELASEKIEDLRGFSELYTTTGREAFQDIANNAGGSIAAGQITVDNQQFNRSWTVVNWYYASPGAAASTTAPAGATLPDMKEVTVSLSWLDLNNEVQSFTLTSLVAKADPRNATRIFR